MPSESHGRALRFNVEKSHGEGEETACYSESIQVIGQEEIEPCNTFLGAKSEESDWEAKENATIPSEGRAAEVRQELLELMEDSRVAYQLNAKSGGVSKQAMVRLLPEFAGQMELENNAEHGFKLAMHFAYWLGRKQQYQSQNDKNLDKDEQRARAEEERHNSVLQRAYELMASSKAGDEPVWPIGD